MNTLIGPRKKLKAYKLYAYLRTVKIKRKLKKRFTSLYLGKNVHIVGADVIEFGDNVVISENSWINVNHRENGPRFIVGNNCLIGKNNFFSVGARIILKDYFFSSKDCKFLGASHEPEPMTPYSSNRVTNKNSITIETNVFIGGGSYIIGNVTIGYGSIIGAGSVVTKDVPPMSIVVGNPARVVKKYDLAKHVWIPYNELEELKYPNESEYIELLQKKNQPIYDYIYAAESSFWL